ncbi:MAG: HAMP domain-containing sensor histidine kinase, partial [Pseudomonadota bacterium]
MSGQAVSRKLLLVFALQVVSISFAVVCGVFMSAKILEDSLIQQALREEAELFASRLALDAETPAPDTVNLKAYLTGRNDHDMPAEFENLEPGFHKVHMDHGDRKALVFVREFDDELIVLKFAEEQVQNLALYFGLVPLALVLLVIYGTTFVTYRLSRRTVSPIVDLARRVENLDLDHIDPDVFNPDELPSTNQEVVSLERALGKLSERVQEMIQRERAFTRDASHELRTPLTVIQMASDMLLGNDALDEFQRRTLRRVKSAAREMQTMLEALLMLARAEASHLPSKQFLVNDVVETELERIRFLSQNRSIQVRTVEECTMEIEGVPSVLAILIGHVVRRVIGAARDDTVTVRISEGMVTVSADGAESGDGPRLPRRECTEGETIIERLSRLFGWPVEIEDRDGRTLRAAIDFPSYTQVSASQRSVGHG